VVTTGHGKGKSNLLAFHQHVIDSYPVIYSLFQNAFCSKNYTGSKGYLMDSDLELTWPNLWYYPRIWLED
jgi:hypothetical protein